jgi:antitoxin MazE
MMEAVLKKWGNSIAVRLPNTILKECELRENRRIEITIENGKIVLTPVKKRPRYDLAGLVARITEDNRHEVVDVGPPVGREIL